MIIFILILVNNDTDIYSFLTIAKKYFDIVTVMTRTYLRLYERLSKYTMELKFRNKKRKNT